MRALEILDGINARMTKKDILVEVSLAKVEMELLDIHQVRERLGDLAGKIKIQALRLRAINNGIGNKVGRMGRVYTPGDVEALRVILTAKERPATTELRENVLKLKATTHLTNSQIARSLGIDPSYIPKLLKRGG